MGFRKYDYSAQEFLRENWDLLTLSLIFIYLIYSTLTYPDIPQQYPLVFLVAGLVFLLVELTAELLPKPYSRKFDRITSGMSDDLSDIDLVEEEYDEQTAEFGLIKSSRTRIAATILMIIGFGILAYYISFLLAIPILVFCIVYVIGSQKLSDFILLTVILIFMVYFLFGDVMNTPILEGELLTI